MALYFATNPTYRDKAKQYIAFTEKHIIDRIVSASAEIASHRESGEN